MGSFEEGDAGSQPQQSGAVFAQVQRHFLFVGQVKLVDRHKFEVGVEALFSALGIDFGVDRREGQLVAGVSPGAFNVDLLLLSFEMEQVGFLVESYAEVAMEGVVFAVFGPIGAFVHFIDRELAGPLSEEGDDFLVAAAG